jgi:predicted amidohydrolase
VGISTVVHGVGERKHIAQNLDTIEDAIHAAMGIISINMPVKLIALAEGALTGFTDEAFDVPHVAAASELFIDVPGEESERLASLAATYQTYLVVQSKARWPEVMPDRYFNTLFVISPTGEVVHKAAKNHLWCRERSCTPHDVYDRWVELFGDGSTRSTRCFGPTTSATLARSAAPTGISRGGTRASVQRGRGRVPASEAVPMTNVGYPGGGT